MKNLRLRSKGNYIQEAEWQQLYVLTEQWKSDLQFYRDDIKFLHHIIDKYFIWMIKKDTINQVREIAVNLSEIDKSSDTLLKKVENHLVHLAGLIDDPFKYDSHVIRAEHEKLEDNLSLFIGKFRDNRKETFKITSHVIEIEKLEHLLTS